MLPSILFIGNERIHLTFLTLSAIHTSRETNKYTQTIFYGGLFFFFVVVMVLFSLGDFLFGLTFYLLANSFSLRLIVAIECVCFFFLLLSANGTEFVSNFIGFNFISPKQVPTKKKKELKILYIICFNPCPNNTNCFVKAQSLSPSFYLDLNEKYTERIMSKPNSSFLTTLNIDVENSISLHVCFQKKKNCSSFSLEIHAKKN